MSSFLSVLLVSSLYLQFLPSTAQSSEVPPVLFCLSIGSLLNQSEDVFLPPFDQIYHNRQINQRDKSPNKKFNWQRVENMLNITIREIKNETAKSHYIYIYIWGE